MGHTGGSMRCNSSFNEEETDMIAIAAEARSALTLSLRPDGSLEARVGEQEATVWIRQSFPWSDPGRLLSLRDADDEEFAFVADVAELEAASRRALERALVFAGFVLE